MSGRKQKSPKRRPARPPSPPHSMPLENRCEEGTVPETEIPTSQEPVTGEELAEVETPPMSEEETAMMLPDLVDQLSRLEKVVRGLGRDSLTLTRGQRETHSTLQTIQSRLDDLDLTIKGLSQTVWRATQESQGHLQNAEQHFAGAIRELETRVREEIKWQLYKSAAQAILPALDDLDLVLGNQQVLVQRAGEEDPLLEAMLLVRNKFSEGLGALGLEEIPIEEGVTQFDPALHQVVEPDIPDELLNGPGFSSGTIIRIRRRGYNLNGRIFRVPQVLIKM